MAKKHPPCIDFSQALSYPVLRDLLVNPTKLPFRGSHTTALLWLWELTADFEHLTEMDSPRLNVHFLLSSTFLGPQSRHLIPLVMSTKVWHLMRVTGSPQSWQSGPVIRLISINHHFRWGRVSEFGSLALVRLLVLEVGIRRAGNHLCVDHKTLASCQYSSLALRASSSLEGFVPVPLNLPNAVLIVAFLDELSWRAKGDTAHCKPELIFRHFVSEYEIQCQNVWFSRETSWTRTCCLGINCSGAS